MLRKPDAAIPPNMYQFAVALWREKKYKVLIITIITIYLHINIT